MQTVIGFDLSRHNKKTWWRCTQQYTPGECTLRVRTLCVQMVVNTEWGAFGDKEEIEFVRNEFDRQLDQQSINPQHQLYVAQPSSHN